MAKFIVQVDLTKQWDKEFTIYAKDESEVEEKIEELIKKYYGNEVEFEITNVNQE